MDSAVEQDHYVAPLKYDWLTSFYDPLLRWRLREEKFKRDLVKQADIASGQRALDLGCGTATLTIMMKRLHPAIEVIGIDGDDKTLGIAQRKVTAAGLNIELKKASAHQINFPNHSFDRVVSSLVFHHLTTERKRQVLSEIYRILKSSGELHIADWGKAQNLFMRSAFFMVQLLDGFATTTENVQGKLPDFIREAGFEEVEERKRYSTVFGTLSLFAAKRH